MIKSEAIIREHMCSDCYRWDDIWSDHMRLIQWRPDKIGLDKIRSDETRWDLMRSVEMESDQRGSARTDDNWWPQMLDEIRWDQMRSDVIV